MVEYRFYVRKGEIIGQSCYLGDESIKVDLEIVRKCVQLMCENNFHTYGLDMGVLNDGQTVVVEVNPPYAIGFYPSEDGEYLMNEEKYRDFLFAGWEEYFTEK